MKNQIKPKIKAIKAGGHCQDRRKLGNEADVVAWIEPNSACAALTTAELYFACTNKGYFTFEVSFSIVASRDVVDVGNPTSGSLLVPPPALDAEFDFNWDATTITRKLPRRKDDCVIRWSVGGVASIVPVANIVSVVTRQ